MVRGMLTVGIWTMASRVLGFARDILIAAWLGAGPVADAFFVANRLPNLFRRLFGEGAFNAAFVPAFSALLATEGRPAAQTFAEQAASVMAFWLLGLTILAEIFMPQVLAVIAPGFAAIPEKFTLAVELSRIAFPYMPLICLTALFSGVLNGLDRFAAAAAAPIFYNLISHRLHVRPARRGADARPRARLGRQRLRRRAAGAGRLGGARRGHAHHPAAAAPDAATCASCCGA